MSKGMTKGELVGNIAEKAGVSKKDAEKVLNAVLSSITEALASGRKVQLVGLVLSKYVIAKLEPAVTHVTQVKLFTFHHVTSLLSSPARL